MRLHPNAPVGEPFIAPDGDQVVAERDQRERDAPAAAGEPVDVASVDDRRLGGTPVRAYVPYGESPADGRGVVVYLHGGGWVFGSLGTADATCRRLADRSGCVVVSVDYRLSPEATWPAAIDDGEAVLVALREGRDVADVDVDVTRTIVAGDSAGAFLATVMARRARDDGRGVAGQALVYPVVRRAALEDRDPQDGTDDGLSTAAMRWYWAQFLGEDPDPSHANPQDPVGDLDPLAADLAGLPATLVLTAEHDVLRPEGEAYADALQAAGVDVVATCWQGMPHGFFRLFTTYPAAGAAVDHVASWCRDVVDGASRSVT